MTDISPYKFNMRDFTECMAMCYLQGRFEPFSAFYSRMRKTMPIEIIQKILSQTFPDQAFVRKSCECGEFMYGRESK